MEEDNISIAAKTAIAGVRTYQYISRPIYNFLGGHGMKKLCKFEPSCSEYTAKALKKYGAIKGGMMGLERLCRCNPWSHGGHDPLD